VRVCVCEREDTEWERFVWLSAGQEQDVLTKRESEREKERASGVLLGRKSKVCGACVRVCVCACVHVCGGGVGWVKFVCIHRGMGKLAMTI